ncbi:spherulin 1a [Endogone sp. FLAS-F59071]|nr:spherulin 1a [Endogone sp. FLAS-F59071]|eukprot:RUS15328.1 spherulin 1a [Endogone sp. FLAS-F59071]
MARFTFTLLVSAALAILSSVNALPYGSESLGLNSTQLRDLELATAITEVQRQQLLMPNDFVFDFLNPPSGVATGDGGKLVSANAANFPALIGHGVAMTIGYLGPCGINLPHTHLRATEIIYIVQGKFETGFFQENGAVFVMNTVEKGMATIFPQGSIHFQQNLDCEDAIFVAAFNNEDPGVSTIDTNFIGGLPAEIVGSALGNLGIKEADDLKKYVPKNPAIGIEECRKRCNLH